MESICFSGGAFGADTLWGEWAEAQGHSVIHFSFKGHRTFVPSRTLFIKTQNELDTAIPHLLEAANFIGKRFPNPGFVRNLLLRNYFQIQYAEAVYAVAPVEDGLVVKGTGWACAMAILRDIPVYAWYDGQWWSREGQRMVPSGEPEKPSGLWAGIGSRDATALPW